VLTANEASKASKPFENLIFMSRNMVVVLNCRLFTQVTGDILTHFKCDVKVKNTEQARNQ
jgi:hypothetical protein